VRLGVPLKVHLDITWRCHLRCIHCYLPQRQGEELSNSEIASLLENLAGLGSLFLLLSGGEVLLRSDFFEILALARRLHFAVFVKTSGTMLNEAAARRLAELHVKRVDVSIYSERPEVHDRITGLEGSFARAVGAIRRLRANGVKVRINQSLMQSGAIDSTGVRQLAAELGADYCCNLTIIPRLNGDRSTVALNIPRNVKRAAMGAMEPTRLTEPSCGSEKLLPLEELACSAGHTGCYISPFGDVYPCVQFPLWLGNVRERSFEKIWRESPALQRWRKVRNADLTVCRACELQSVCSRCPGLACLEGDLLGPSRLDCEMAYARTGRRPAPLAE